MELNKKSKEFVEVITKTDEFMKLKTAKSVIDKNKNLKKRVEDFKKKQMEVYTSKKSQKDMELELTELNRKFQNISQIPEVNAFFKSTKEFNDMMYKVFKNINDSLDAKLDSK